MTYYVYFFYVSVFIVTVLAILSVMISVCITGLGSISRKPEPTPPLSSHPRHESQQEVMRTLSSLGAEPFAVRYIAGVYYVLTTAGCKLSDDAILKPLTSRFPKCIFCVKRTLSP